MAKLYVDGFTIDSNPSPKGGGYVIIREGKVYKKEYENKNFTNNEAELRGLLAATEMATDKDTIYSDSLCAISWVKRGSAKARPDLNDYAARAKGHSIMKHLKIKQVDRSKNLAGIYIEEQSGKKKKEIPVISRDPIKEGDQCPSCKAHERDGIMVRRKGKYGEFLGCNKFPQCYHVEKIKSEDLNNWDLIQQANAILGPSYKLI